MGDEIEFFGPRGNDFVQVIENMRDEEGNNIETAPHPQQIVKIPVRQKVYPYDLLRKEKMNDE